MKAPRHYHSSPFYSFVTVPGQPVPLRESLRTIWRWCRGVRLSARERQIEAAVIERLVEEMNEEGIPDNRPSATARA